jgi:excisionase family DNA binding protein
MTHTAPPRSSLPILTQLLQSVELERRIADICGRLVTAAQRDADRLAAIEQRLDTWAGPTEPRLAFGPAEAAEALGVSEELVFDLLRRGELGSVKAGRRRLISRAHIDAFLAGDSGRP